MEAVAKKKYKISQENARARGSAAGRSERPQVGERERDMVCSSVEKPIEPIKPKSMLQAKVCDEQLCTLNTQKLT